jgi:hypothetical protein
VDHLGRMSAARERVRHHLQVHPHRRTTTSHQWEMVDQEVWVNSLAYQPDMAVVVEMKSRHSFSVDGDSDGVHCLLNCLPHSEGEVRTEADHGDHPTYSGATVALVLPTSTGLQKWNASRKAPQEWGNTEDERLADLARQFDSAHESRGEHLRAWVVYLAGREDATPLATLRLEALSRPGLRNLGKYVAQVLQFNQASIYKYSTVTGSMREIHRAFPTMAVLVDSSVRYRAQSDIVTQVYHKSIGVSMDEGLSQTYGFTLGSAVPKMHVVVEFPADIEVTCAKTFYKYINGVSAVNTTIARGMIPTFPWDSAVRVSAGSVGCAWEYLCPRAKYPALLSTMEEARQGREDGSGPWTISESDPDSLFLVRQKFAVAKEDRIQGYEDILRDLHQVLRELGGPATQFLDGYRPIDTWRVIISFRGDADRRAVASALESLNQYEVMSVMTGLNAKFRQRAAGTVVFRGRPSSAPKPIRAHNLQVFVGATPGVEHHALRLAISVFGKWDDLRPSPSMWGDPSCTYYTFNYAHAPSVGLAAGQYLSISPGQHVHLTTGCDDRDEKVIQYVDKKLRSEAAKQPPAGAPATFMARVAEGRSFGAEDQVKAVREALEMCRRQEGEAPATAWDKADEWLTDSPPEVAMVPVEDPKMDVSTTECELGDQTGVRDALPAEAMEL